jgi:cysteinyl-tRNA synthetase
VRQGNQAVDDEDLTLAANCQGQVLAMTEMLGINPFSPEWKTEGRSAADAVLARLVGELLTERETARNTRDFATADRIRDALIGAGVSVEDTASGAHWRIDAQQ